jgi:hypothetical protein
MVRSISRVIAVLLLGTMLASPYLGTMAFGLTANPSAAPAGCHSHGRRVPPPQPVSYKCCATGHQHAIPGTSFSASTPLSFLCRADQARQALRTDTGTTHRQILTPFSPGSPGSSLLRI